MTVFAPIFASMNRSSFLKSLFVLAASPKVLAELQTQPKIVMNPGIFNDLRFVIPEWIPELCKKYGSENFHQLVGENATYIPLTWPIEMIQHFEKPRLFVQATTGASI
jgi:hypothetical protein